MALRSEDPDPNRNPIPPELTNKIKVYKVCSVKKIKIKLFVSVSKRNDTAKTKMTEVYLYATTAFGLPILCPTRFEPPSSRLEASNIPVSARVTPSSLPSVLVTRGRGRRRTREKTPNFGGTIDGYRPPVS